MTNPASSAAAPTHGLATGVSVGDLLVEIGKAIEALRNVPFVGDAYDQQHSDTHMSATLSLQAIEQRLRDAGFIASQVQVAPVDPAPVFAYFQEGGATGEMYLHTFETKAEADAGARSCARAAYRTTPIVTIARSAADADGFADAVQDFAAVIDDLEYAPYDGNDATEMSPPWSSEHAQAAAAEGWRLLSTDDGDTWEIQRLDDAGGLQGGAQLASDDDAALLVARGEMAHHLAALAFLEAHEPNEHERLFELASAELQRPRQG